VGNGCTPDCEFFAQSTVSALENPYRRLPSKRTASVAKRKDTDHHTRGARLSSPLRTDIPSFRFPPLTASIAAELESLQHVAGSSRKAWHIGRDRQMSRAKTVVKCVVIGLLVATIFLQAVARLLSGNIFYVNYKNQPLNSFGALIVVAIVLMAGMILLWRRLKSRVK
jgi:Ca2+/H+ antiporter